MTAYDYLMNKVTEIAVTKKERQFIENLLTEFPQWSDEKIANLTTSTIEVVKSIRAELKK